MGQTFGHNYSPSNFDIPALSCVQWAWLLWTNEADTPIAKAEKYVKSIQFVHNCADSRPFAQANADSKKINPGVVDNNGNRIPTVYVNHVNDNLYADVEKYMLHTVACSIVLSKMHLAVHKSIKTKYC